MKIKIVSYLSFLSFALTCASVGVTVMGWALALYAATLGDAIMCDNLMFLSFAFCIVCLPITGFAHNALFDLELRLLYPRKN